MRIPFVTARSARTANAAARADDGASFDTTSGHKFKCICTISEIGSTLSVKAMQ